MTARDEKVSSNKFERSRGERKPLTGSEDDSDNESPPRELRVASVASRHRHGERTDNDSAVYPHRDLLVNAHLLVVRVVDLAGLELADSVQNRAPVPAAKRGRPPKGRASQLPASEVRSGFRSYLQADVRQSCTDR